MNADQIPTYREMMMEKRRFLAELLRMIEARLDESQLAQASLPLQMLRFDVECYDKALARLDQQGKNSENRSGELVALTPEIRGAIKRVVEAGWFLCAGGMDDDNSLYKALEVLEQLLAIDVDEPDHYDHWSNRNEASWEVRKVLSENRRLQARIKHLEAAAAVIQAIESKEEE